MGASGIGIRGQLPVRSGDVIANKYRVEGLLGAGAMGFVVAARHLQLDQLVAIKFVLPEALGDADVVRRFVREARAAASLKSEHVARVTDVGSIDSGAPYIVMEYLHGQDLGKLLAVAGPLPVGVAVDYVLQACDAVAEAHRMGIVHRDLKPANLFLTTAANGRPLVKILDFGISKSSMPSELNMTRTKMIMGSPAYMSPEQMRSTRNVDARSDIWSLGVILWELVTGQAPFAAETFTELCIRIAVDPLPPLPDLAGVPAGFEAVLARSLEKELANRYRSVDELVARLAPFASPGPVAAAASRAASTLDTAVGQRDQSGPREPRARTRLAIGAASGIVVAGLVAAILLAAGRRAPVPAPSQRGPAPEPAPSAPAELHSGNAPVLPTPTTAPPPPPPAPTPTTPTPPPRERPPKPDPHDKRTTASTGVATSAPGPTHAAPPPEPELPKASAPREPTPEEPAAPEAGRPLIVDQRLLEAQRQAGSREVPLPPAVRQALLTESKTSASAMVKLCLDAAGAPISVAVARSTGYPEADQNLKDEISRWRYGPTLVDGQARPVCTALTFRYQITR